SSSTINSFMMTSCWMILLSTHTLLLPAGGVAGAIAVTLTYPTDVLRRRMMMQGLGGDTPRTYSGLLDACSKIMKAEGIPGFFRGLIPCYLKVIPSSAISWGTIELCRKVVGGG